MTRYFACCLFLLFAYSVPAQQLKPGFDADEYIGVLQRCAGQIGHVIYPASAPKLSWQKVYTSKELGLHNHWELWLSTDKTVMAVNLRGTTRDMDNGLENLYSAMIPATGALKINDSTTYNYKFSADARAMVHVGWTIGICSMLPDIMAHVNEQYAKGVKQIIVEGHSQGGSLSFLLSAYLHCQVADGKLPADLIIKTYCSAAPKTGNLYFAYDFDYMNRDGWAHTVVSSIDWVPEMPYTIQKIGDVNDVNPFKSYKVVLKKQNIFVRLYLSHVYNRMTRSTRRAQRRYEKHMGGTAYKFVRKYLPQFEQPTYTHSLNYVSAGTPVVLVPDDAYYKEFANSKQHVFMHHFFEQYYFLTNRIYKQQGVH